MTLQWMPFEKPNAEAGRRYLQHPAKDLYLQHKGKWAKALNGHLSKEDTQ